VLVCQLAFVFILSYNYEIMKVLAIETSCDETGISVVEGSHTDGGFVFRILANALLSQATLHAEYGGVYPTLAKREHQKNLPLLLKQALTEAKIDLQSGADIEAIAVTEGPGLEPALWTGITFATELAKKWQKPLFGVNHMEGHLISSLAVRESQVFKLEHIKFPILGLLVSGGHTLFVQSDHWFKYKVLGETLDDAVGECFDKVARMLGLPYPGGPEISKLAEHARLKGIALTQDTTLKATPFKLPRPLLNRNTCDTSFSGLKTAVLYALRDMGGAESLSEQNKAAFAREFEDAVIEVFVSKTKKALMESQAQTFTLGGGVAANAYMRKSLVDMIEREFPYIEIRLPDLSITGDNAIMIAEAALTHLLLGDWKLNDPVRELKADGNLQLA
jgi:N6-L-threonylcarbamoyladenine synthase